MLTPEASSEHLLGGLLPRGAAAGVPAAGAFELSSRCHLACRMSYIRRDAGDARGLPAEVGSGPGARPNHYALAYERQRALEGAGLAGGGTP